MDSLSSTIANLRAALATANALAEAVEAAVDTLPVAAAVPVAVAVPAAELPMPPPIQRQQALGVATPAAFGCAKANADYYLAGKGLYSGALARRYQDYHDGCWAYSGKAYFIYRFFVFEEVVAGAYTGTQAAHWKPIGLLNPHAYNAYKASWTRGSWNPIGLLNPHTYNAYKASWTRGKSFLDFVDASQPAPDVTAYWQKEPEMVWMRVPAGFRTPNGIVYEKECITAVKSTEVDAYIALGAQCGVGLLRTPAAGGGGGGGGAAAPAAAAPPAAPPAPPHCHATPAGFACCMATCNCRPSNPLDPRADSLLEEMNELEAVAEDQRSMPHCVRLHRLRENWHGRWTTLPSGERALIYHFHAFAPPADGSYRTAQPLKHLGFYNYYDRSLSETTSCPVLPGQASWPW